MPKIIEELRRRTVFKVTGAYVVVGWLLAQAALVFQTALGLPEWFDGFVLSLLLLGLPIAALLAWAFEVTPEGIRPTTPLDSDHPQTRSGFKPSDLAVVFGLLCVAVAVSISSMRADAGSSVQVAATPEVVQPVALGRRVAVLPFADMTASSDHSFLGDGMAEEVLNLLARSSDLSVAARTSSFHYRNLDSGMQAIGKELGVDLVLEGSVKVEGEILRVTASLARTDTGFTVWSETFERPFTDILQVQVEIAERISKKLRASAGNSTTARPQSVNAEAYTLFVQANSLFRQRGKGVSGSIPLYQQALKKDPDFAPTWARLAIALSALPHWMNGQDFSSEVSLTGLKAHAETAASRAVELDPTLAASQHALGVTLRERWQWERSAVAFETALSISPNQPEILEDYVELLSDIGRWDEAVTQARRLVEIDPNSGIHFFRLGLAESNVGNEIAALSAFETQRKIAPEASSNSIMFTVALLAEHDGLETARAFLASCETCSVETSDLARLVLKASEAQMLDALEGVNPVKLDGLETLLMDAGGRPYLLHFYRLQSQTGNIGSLARKNRATAAIFNEPAFMALRNAAQLSR